MDIIHKLRDPDGGRHGFSRALDIDYNTFDAFCLCGWIGEGFEDVEAAADAWGVHLLWAHGADLPIRSGTVPAQPEAPGTEDP